MGNSILGFFLSLAVLLSSCLCAINSSAIDQSPSEGSHHHLNSPSKFQESHKSPATDPNHDRSDEHPCHNFECLFTVTCSKFSSDQITHPLPEEPRSKFFIVFASHLGRDYLLAPGFINFSQIFESRLQQVRALLSILLHAPNAPPL